MKSEMDLHSEANQVQHLGPYMWHGPLPKVLDMILYSLKGPLKL